MFRPKTRRARCALSLCGISMLTAPAWAAADTSSGEKATIEEVTVTARKREESLQKVPIAMAVFDAESIRESRIDAVEDVAIRLPGVGVSSPYRSNMVIAIRGASTQDDSPGVDQSVNTFVDGIYVGTIAGVAMDLLDLERIEVLRGPQGTLFGRNTTGGVLNFITRDPNSEFRLNGHMSLGNFGSQDVGGGVSGPLVDGAVYGSLAGKSSQSGGYVRNVHTGNMLGRENVTSARGKLRFTPNDITNIVFSGDVTHDRTYGIPRFFQGELPQSLIDAGVVMPDSLSRTNQDIDGNYDRKVYGLTGTIEVDTAIGTLTSLSSYRRHENHMYDWDGDALPLSSADPRYSAASITENGKIDTYTQELRLNSQINDRLYAVGGFYYLHQKYGVVNEYSLSGAPGSVIGEMLVNPAESGGQEITTRSIAVFADGTYQFNNRVSLSVGARWTRDTKGGSNYCLAPGLICGNGYDVNGDGIRDAADGEYTFNAKVNDKSWSEPTWRISPQFQVNDDLMLYATYARGFKSGGFPVQAAPELVGIAYEPEFADSYEIGARSEWLDRRLKINATLFYVEYTDLQFLDFEEDHFVSGNLGGGRDQGLELELMMLPLPGLEISADYVFQDSEYLRGTIVSGVDFSGNPLQLTPEHSFNLGASYSFDIGSAGSVKLSGAMVQKSRQYQDPNALFVYSTVYRDIFNARLAFTSSTERWEVALWGQNLADKRSAAAMNVIGAYSASPADLALDPQFRQAALTMPRTYGITFTWRYE